MKVFHQSEILKGALESCAGLKKMAYMKNSKTIWTLRRLLEDYVEHSLLASLFHFGFVFLIKNLVLKRTALERNSLNMYANIGESFSDGMLLKSKIVFLHQTIMNGQELLHYSNSNPFRPGLTIPVHLIGLSNYKMDSAKLNRGILHFCCTLNDDAIKTTASDIFKSTNLAWNQNDINY